MAENATGAGTNSQCLQEVLSTVDKSAPVTVDVLVKLISAQTDYLLSEFNKKLSAQEETIKSQSQTIQSLKSENLALRKDLDDLQQYSRRNSIRIEGIPAPDDGEKEPINELESKVNNLFKDTLKVNLVQSDFCRVHRIGRPKEDGTPRQVIVKFTNYGAKRRIMSARKACKNYSGKYPVYVNDDLTRQRAKLAANARALKRSTAIDSTWVYDGKIFIKLLTGAIKVVTSQEDLDTI